MRRYQLSLASSTILLASLIPAGGVNASPSPLGTSPIVKLDYGSFQGNATGPVVQFLGMPFAAPPLGNLRFSPPKPPQAFTDVRQATQFGAACFQQDIGLENLGAIGLNLSSLIVSPPVVSEDCLFINVVRPANVSIGKKLPVVFWIYGGGFEEGDTGQNPGNSVVTRSITLGDPIIYVSSNYRLNAFGFLGGKEVKAAGIANAGIHDQRFALQWVQSHISAFGGDPRKVTIWGESAGAYSVGIQLVLNNGNPAGLFHGAFMNSGSPITLRYTETNQPHFDQLVANTNCTGAANPITCLRGVPFDKLGAAINQSPGIFSFSSLQLVWEPTIDGQFITHDPLVSVQKGLYAKVPIVSGDCADEGTTFSFTTLNITNGADFLNYMADNYFLGKASDAQIASVNRTYPDDITQGSPFDTGTANALTPEFKRLAAIQGDLYFQAPRRFFLEVASKTQPTYAFLCKRGKNTPVAGAFHGSDLTAFYGVEANPDFIATDALINSVNSGNPNGRKNPISLLSTVDWKMWGSSATEPPLLTFIDEAPRITITPDTYRAEGMKVLTNISLTLAGSV